MAPERETILDFTVARDMGWQWHQLDDVQIICTSLRQITAPVPTTQLFAGQIPFLSPNQRRQSTEGFAVHLY